MLRYSKKEPRRERQLRHCEFLFKCGQSALANRLIRCADSAAIAQRLSLTYPDYQCDSRYCEYCGRRNAARYRRTYGPILERLVYQGYRLNHLTLTSKDIARLERGRSDSLLQAFTKMYRSKLLKSRVVGAFAQYEIKFNGDWHMHLHIVLVCNKCISWKEISKLWERLTGSYQIDIRSIDYAISTPQSVHNAIGKVMNYICKYTSFDNQFFGEMFQATYKKKLVRTYGLVRKRGGNA